MSESRLEEQRAVERKIFFVRAAIGVIVVALVLLIFWMRNAEMSRVKEQAQKDLRAANETAAAKLDADRKQNAIRLAEGMGAVFGPLIASDRDMKDAMKSVVETASSRGKIELIVVTDATGKVLATSNARLALGTFPEVMDPSGTERKTETGWEVTRQILYGGNPVGGIKIHVTP